MNVITTHINRDEIKTDVENLIENFGDLSQRAVLNQRIAIFFYQKTIKTR